MKFNIFAVTLKNSENSRLQEISVCPAHYFEFFSRHWYQLFIGIESRENRNEIVAVRRWLARIVAMGLREGLLCGRGMNRRGQSYM